MHLAHARRCVKVHRSSDLCGLLRAAMVFLTTRTHTKHRAHPTALNIVKSTSLRWDDQLSHIFIDFLLLMANNRVSEALRATRLSTLDGSKE